MAKIKFYLDENVNPAIAEGLRRRTVQTVHSEEVGNSGANDETQLSYAAQIEAVLFTHDIDLVDIAFSWLSIGKEHWGVIYVHQLSCSIGESIRRLKEYVDLLDAQEMRNRVEFL